MNKPQNNEAKCPVAHRTPDAEDFERDFTTPGVQGNLGCPFARMSNGLPNGLDGQTDPIAAEFHQDKISTTSPVSEQKPGKCPIRFLDKHSPEEIAKYFENHKHEIPRSHEICVRRYQQNESSARQLDAKYGSLVNMIQGLGVKHKAYLPERDRIEEHDRRSSSHAVEKWAENLSEHPPPAKDEDLPSEEAPRVPHFERTLREVRVGESPSRPWGISVPADNEPSPSALQSQDGIEHLKIQPESSSAEADAKPTAGAAADHSEITSQKKPLPRNDPASTTTKEPRTQIIFNGPTFLTFLPEESRTQITYNGPVFLGYSADEVINLLQRTNIVSATTTGANMG